MQSLSVRKVLRRGMRLPARKKRFLLEAAFWLTVGRLLLAVLPFQRIGRYLGDFHSPATTLPLNASSGLTLAREVAWAIDRAANVLPLRLVCLPRAVAAAQMLLLRGVSYRVHFGAQRAPSEPKMMLHAWVDVDGIDVAGTRTASEFTEVGFFARAGSRGIPHTGIQQR